MCLADAAHSYDLMNRPSVSVLFFLTWKKVRNNQSSRGKSQGIINVSQVLCKTKFPKNGLIENVHFLVMKKDWFHAVKGRGDWLCIRSGWTAAAESNQFQSASLDWMITDGSHGFDKIGS